MNHSCLRKTFLRSRSPVRKKKNNRYNFLPGGAPPSSGALPLNFDTWDLKTQSEWLSYANMNDFYNLAYPANNNNLDRTSTDKQVTRIYHKLAMKYHPDRNVAVDDGLMKKINNAYFNIVDVRQQMVENPLSWPLPRPTPPPPKTEPPPETEPPPPKTPPFYGSVFGSSSSVLGSSIGSFDSAFNSDDESGYNNTNFSSNAKSPPQDIESKISKAAMNHRPRAFARGSSLSNSWPNSLRRSYSDSNEGVKNFFDYHNKKINKTSDYLRPTCKTWETKETEENSENDHEELLTKHYDEDTDSYYYVDKLTGKAFYEFLG